MLRNRPPLPGRARPRPAEDAPPAAPAPVAMVPKPHGQGSALAVLGCVLTMLFAGGEQPSDIGHMAAIGFGLSLATTLAFDLRAGIRNLIRADVLALVAYYFLTLYEFLFPHRYFDQMVVPDETRSGIQVILLGAIGMLAGRHLYRPKRLPLQTLLHKEMPPGILITVFCSAFLVGFWHMLLATDFDVWKVIDAMMGARFTQPWARGKLGDWKALVVELGMLIYLIPPLAGIVLARYRRYALWQLLIVVAGLGCVFFYGFTSGTRNLFAAYLVTLLIGYTFAVEKERQYQVYLVGAACALVMGIATPMMLAFRNVGFKTWIEPTYVAPENSDMTRGEGVFVDDNLYAICKIMQFFPSQKAYLGLEIPYNALIRPIPRALWPGKPEGLTFTIEDALGVSDMTISATFAGEAYMAGGPVGVFVTALLFGLLFGWWNYLGSTENSELGILIYASGFFAAVISMRSLFSFTTALMPTLAAIVLATLLVKQLIRLERKLAQLRSRRQMHETGSRAAAPARPLPPR